MKELRKLDRRLRWSECVHLALLTLCLSVTISLFFTEDSAVYRLLWALGAVIPVQLVRLICLRVEKKPLRVLLCFVVLGLTLAATLRNYHWVCYCAALFPILLSGLILPRSRGNMVFTVPTVYTLFFPLPFYILGQALNVPLVSRLMVVLSALLTLNFLIYTNLSRLVFDLRVSSNTEISVASIVRQNDKVIAVFALIAVLLIAAVPFLLRTEPVPEEKPSYDYTEATEESTEPSEIPLPDYMPSKKYEEHRLSFIPEAAIALIFVAGIGAFAVILVVLIRTLVNRIDRREKKQPPDPAEELTIERLEEDPAAREKEKLSGWEKKIRRRYEKLILRRTSEKNRLQVLTPSELESAAGLSGQPETGELHEIYEQTRYGTAAPTREDYQRFKELEKRIP